MPPFRNSVRRQRLRVRVLSEADALALRPHLADLNRRHVVPVLERVLDELAPADRQVRLERLDLDLGRIPPGRLAEELGRRVERELRRALGDALREAPTATGEAAVAPGAAGPPATGAVWRSEAAARREVLEHYLLYGTLPYWGRRPGAVSLALLVAEMAEADPDGLVAVLRRLGARDHVLKRLAAQAGAEGLVRIVHLLEPEHAARVLAYATDLETVHRSEALIPLGERPFHRLLWWLVQAWLLRDRGTVFNRRSYLRSLLRGLARGRSLEYADLLATLARALERTALHGRVGVSFTAMVAELVREERPLDPAAPGVEVEAPGVEVEAPGVEVEASGAEVEASGVEVEASGAEMKRSGAGAEAPGAVVEAPGAGAEVPGTSVAVEGGRAGAGRGVEPPATSSSAPVTPAATLPDSVSPRAGAAVVDPDGEPAHRLAGRLVARLRGEAGAAAADVLLAALLRRHPADVRYQLRAVGAVPDLAASLAAVAVEEAPEPLLEPLLEGMVPAAAPVLRAFLEALDRLPSPYRPASPAEIRRSVLHEALLSGAEEPGDAFFGRLLRRLFGHPLSRPVGRHLAAAVEEWSARGRLPAAVVGSFRTALVASGGVPAATAARGSRERTAAPSARRAALAWLWGEAGGARPPAGLARELEALLAAPPADWTDRLRRHAGDRRLRRRWIRALPEPLLARLLAVFEPQRHRTVLEATELLAAAWRDALPLAGPSLAPEVAADRSGDLAGRPAFWDFLFRFLDRHAGADHLLERLVGAFFADRGERWRAAVPAGDDPVPVGERLVAGVEGRVRTGGHAHLRAALEARREDLLERWRRAAPEPRPALPAAAPEAGPGRDDETAQRRDLRTRAVPDHPGPERSPASRSAAPRSPASRSADSGRPGRPSGGAATGDASPSRTTSSRTTPSRPSPYRPSAEPVVGPGDDPDALYVANAGLVLAGAFLPRLFGLLGLLEDGDDGKPRVSDPDRAVHLLQYLVDGRTDAPEPDLVLNKVLCGLPTGFPVDAAGDLDAAALGAAESLLRSMLGNWSVLSGTSVAGLRETFLQREGRLERREDRDRLTVQRKTLDVLVDQVPWSISVVFHSWMRRPLHVEW